MWRKVVRNMDKTVLREILKNHKEWLEDMGGKQADLHGVDLRRVCLCGADLRKVDLSDADLRKADLRYAGMRRADMRGADLREADLCWADLCGAYMCGADLCGADLCKANLRGADLRDAYLCGAYLRGADLRDADLRKANLFGADLREANLCGANLRGADLHGADLSQKIVQVGPIGSRSDYTIYRVDEDIVQCGCWKEYAGGSLADFIARINEAYPEDNEDGMKYRREYLAAISMFQALREDYLKDSQRERMAKGEET